MLLAPTARDAKLCGGLLAEAGVDAVVCRDMNDICAGIDTGAGLAVLSEESLTVESLNLLRLVNTPAVLVTTCALTVIFDLVIFSVIIESVRYRGYEHYQSDIAEAKVQRESAR